MSKPIIEVKGISKRYQMGGYQPYYNLRDALANFTRDPLKRKSSNNHFWALDNVSFSVKPGEVVGIIGKNGSGKSTLLKILSRITPPTRGSALIRGKVVSLLEVGTGFHSELTGRENIYLNGSILGMTRSEIKSKFDEIVAFSEIDKFIDTPVKHYSSGMYMRLAFAVAAHLDPEILIIDEVLSVGDANFQKKSLGKINEVSKNGRTVLFVSHSMNSVSQLCDRAILLEAGKIIDSGTTQKIINKYLASYPETKSQESLLKTISSLPPDPTVKLNSIRLYQGKHQVFENIVNGKDLKITIDYEVLETVTGLRVSIDMFDTDNNMLFRSFHDEDHSLVPTMTPGRYTSTVLIPADILGPIDYELRVNIAIFNVRTCIPYPSLRIPLRVKQTGRYNRAYTMDTFRGKLGLCLPWTTIKR